MWKKLRTYLYDSICEKVYEHSLYDENYSIFKGPYVNEEFFY
jgi:hypothetical protein